MPPGSEFGAPTGVLGPYGATNGPTIATRTSSPTRITPILVRHSRIDRRSSDVARTGGVSSGTARRRDVGPRDRDHSRVRRRGVTMMVATSASRLSTTYSAAMSMASACTTGRSWLTTASCRPPPMPV